MIGSFASAGTARVFRRERVRRLPPALLRVALRKLVQLDAATILDDLRLPPGNRLERLAGERAGQCSIRINDRWRVCCVRRDGNTHEEELVDYD